MSAVAFPNLIFFLVLSLLLVSIVAQSHRNISLGSSLTATGAGTSWLSPSGDFAFGFHPLKNKDSFLLAIWFDKIPDKTIVWHPEGIQSVSRGSKVELTNDGRLLLTDQQGQELWNPAITGISYVAMLDNGNFILAGKNSITLWQSFNNPTDTILPTQTLEQGGVLYSRLAQNTYSKGRFRLRLAQGNLMLNTAAFPSLTENIYDAYYSADTSDSSITNPLVGMVFNETGDIYLLRRNGMIAKLTWEDKILNTDIYSRATLDSDGVFVQYSYPKNSRGNQTWKIERLLPDDICDAIRSNYGNGACGYNSYCVLTSERRPSCNCPPKYSFVDPNNTFSDCSPDFIPGCLKGEAENPEDVFEFHRLDKIDWPLSDYERMEPYSEASCINACMDDCLCSVAIISSSVCWKKKLPLSNGGFKPRWTGTALIKVKKEGVSNQSNCRVSDTDKNNSASASENKKSNSTLI